MRVRHRVRPLITGAVALALGTNAGLLAAAAPAEAAPVASPHAPVASSRTPAGLAGVQSARLVQSGRSLDWTVTLVHGISRRGVASSHRSLCLELEGRRTRRLIRTICLSAPAHSSRLDLIRVLARGARTRPLPGTVARNDGGRTVVASFSPVPLGLPYRSLRWQVRSEARGRGCPPMHVGQAVRHVCARTFPAHRAPLVALHTPQLVGCVPAGPSLVYQGPTGRHEIALTFDDGPWDDPPSIDFVNELKGLGVPATFFEIGEQISEFDPTGSVERAMLADGDMIGDHTWTHPQMTRLSPAEQTAQFERTNAAIRHATGFEPCLWRPPYGATNPALESLARGLGMLTIYWSDDTRDWSLPGTGSIVATALREASDGGIILMHFGGGPRLETLEAVPQIVAALRARGYRFVNLAHMLGLREIWR